MTPRSALPWRTAVELAGSAVGPVEARLVPLEAAAGAVLAQDAVARSDLPAVDTSAMDGWAVAGPPPWRVVGEVLAGTVGAPLTPGSAAAIATGAAVPAGADGVLRRELGSVHGGMLAPASSGPVTGLAADVRPAGRECRRGEPVLPAGSLLTPAAIGLLAAAGHDEVPVRRPAVDLLVLGDELLGSGPARDGRLRDALGPLLVAAADGLGLVVASRRRVPDTAGALTTALRGCVGDLIVTTGSTARGPVDHLHGVLGVLGARMVVDGVDVRPGHPQLLAVLPDGRPLVGLPGNPLAAVSGLVTLLRPVAWALAGRCAPAPALGVLATDVAAGGEATRLVPVAGGRPVRFAGPAMLRGLAVAEHLAVVPPGGVRAGDPVELLALP